MLDDVVVMCPTCKRKLPFSADANPFRPFCSERCRLVDLGSWLDGVHRISTPISEDDLDQSFGGGRDAEPEGQGQEQQRRHGADKRSNRNRN